MENYKYMISVVMPLYNAEKYLEESIVCVLEQTIGFRENVQLILINDGSIDSSDCICKKYKKQYPDNIIYIYKTNGGVSSARNQALEYIEGEYTHFLDSDDLIDKDAYEKIICFMKENKNLEAVSFRVETFERKQSMHILDYRFNDGDQVVDLTQKPKYIQSLMCSMIFRSKAIEGISFREDIKISEDVLFVGQVLLKTLKLGIKSDVSFYYRKRKDSSSISDMVSIETSKSNLEVCKILISDSRRMYGEVIDFIQITVLYILRWRLFERLNYKFSLEDRVEWRNDISQILYNVEEKNLKGLKFIDYNHKLAILKLKYGSNKQYLSINNKGKIVCNGVNVANLNFFDLFSIFSMRINDDKLYIEGVSRLSYISDDFRLEVVDSVTNDVFQCELIPFSVYDEVFANGEICSKFHRFKVILPISGRHKFSFYSYFPSLDDEKKHKMNPGFRQYAYLERTDSSYYTVLDKYILKYIKKSIRVYPYNKRTHIVSELRRIKKIIVRDKYTFSTRVKYIVLRLLYHISRKNVWLFMDKEWAAGDNGEYLYRYALKHSGTEEKLYFALEKSSNFYKKIKGYGKLVEPFTFRYELLFLRSIYMVSSRTEYAIRNPFGQNRALVKDLIHQKFIYLSHGTLFGDLSGILNKMCTNFSLYAVSSKCEYDNLLGEKYGYSEDDIKILGMPRYDGFKNAEKEKIIAFLPTWRSSLAGKIIPGTTKRAYNEEFKDTEYYKFYNNLINHPKLLTAMKTYGYVGEFYMHPALIEQSKDFIQNDIISVGSKKVEYEEILKKSALLITDFSGVGFDFGYQRKPIVYSHFDSIFTSNHTYGDKSYFNYEEEGFGPVTYTLEETVNCIIEYIKNDCIQSKKYRDRAEKFFAYNDYNNCKRIYDAIISL